MIDDPDDPDDNIDSPIGIKEIVAFIIVILLLIFAFHTVR